MISTKTLIFGMLLMTHSMHAEAANGWLNSWLSLVGVPWKKGEIHTELIQSTEGQDLDFEAASEPFLAETRQEAIHEKFLEEVYRDIREQMDVAVIGMSGGADSTLVAILCAQALGPENVMSVHMPFSNVDQTYFNARSLRTAHHLKVHTKIVPLQDIVHSFEKSLVHELTMSTLNKGNLKSRVRTTLLYSIGHHLGDTGRRVRVVGTGNLSEDYIGYDTKGGDALADYFPIGDLFKSEVYALLDHFAKKEIITESMIDRVPSAGLWEGQTDEDELGMSYNDMEPAIRRLLRDEFLDSEVDNFVRKRHAQNKHKHEAPAVFKSRYIFDQN